SAISALSSIVSESNEISILITEKKYTFLKTSAPYPGFQFLDLLLASLHGDLLSFIQTVLQVLDGLLHVLLHALQMSAGVSLHLLLQSERFIPAGINHSLLVPLGLLHLFIFLSQLTFNISFDLIELQLSSKDLSFFMLQGALTDQRT
uniref:Uncharacterized protein n=1 Tax=Cyprinus carpio TaxID=7962 RepID=A0A8C1VPC1_CYPCA